MRNDRMHRTPTALVIASVLFAALLALPAAADDGECATYGDGVRLGESTPLATILAAPDVWAGRMVRVEGEIREVCPMAGCWLSIVAAGDSDGALRVKVEDGEIVFPLSARGRQASAEGVVEVHDMTREQYASWLEHLAEERDEPFDPTSVGDGPYRRVQVKAGGAAICPRPQG